MRVRAQEQRPGDARARAVLADRLRDGQDVGLVERAVLGGAAVAAGSEGDALPRVRGIGSAIVVGGDQTIDVDEDIGGGGLSGERRAAWRDGKLPGVGGEEAPQPQEGASAAGSATAAIVPPAKSASQPPTNIEVTKASAPPMPRPTDTMAGPGQ